MITRYLICGGRDFTDSVLLDKALRALILHPLDAVIIHGDARGADRMAAAWGKAHGAQIDAYLADWVKYDRAGGPIRNRAMLQLGKPDVVIAFPGGPGTANMVKQTEAWRAKNGGAPLLIVVTGEGGDWYGNPAK